MGGICAKNTRTEEENAFETLANIDCPAVYYAPYYNDFGSLNDTADNVSAVDIATFEQCNILIDADEGVPEGNNADRWGVFADWNNSGNVFAISFAETKRLKLDLFFCLL